MHAQREAQPITANRIGFLTIGVSGCEFTDVTRIGEVIFESFGVQSLEFEEQVSSSAVHRHWMSNLIERRELSKFINHTLKNLDHVVDIRVRIVFAEAEADRAPGEFIVATKRLNNRGRFKCA